MEEAQELLWIVEPLIRLLFRFMMDMYYHKVRIVKHDPHFCDISIFHDNFICTGIVKSPLGGDFISLQCTQHFDEHGIEVIPPYMIAGKEQVWENEKAKYTKRSNIPDVTKSWHKYMVKVWNAIILIAFL